MHAALIGGRQLFAREDSVEETWRIVRPLLDHPPDVRPYPRESWGPDDAETRVRGHPAGSSHGCPRTAEPPDCWARGLLRRVSEDVKLGIRLIGVGRLAHGLAGLEYRAEGAAQRRDRGGQPGQADLVGHPGPVPEDRSGPR